jgi:hypothetical protein
MKIIAVFKRLETDAEFRLRLANQGEYLPPHASHAKGEELDDFAWGHLRRQRRIVEGVAER